MCEVAWACAADCVTGKIRPSLGLSFSSATGSGPGSLQGKALQLQLTGVSEPCLVKA